MKLKATIKGIFTVGFSAFAFGISTPVLAETTYGSTDYKTQEEFDKALKETSSGWKGTEETTSNNDSFVTNYNESQCNALGSRESWSSIISYYSSNCRVIISYHHKTTKYVWEGGACVKYETSTRTQFSQINCGVNEKTRLPIDDLDR